MKLTKVAVLPLILLDRGAAPPSDCSAGSGNSGVTTSGGTLPAQMDLPERPGMPAGPTGQVFAALPTPQVAAGCGSPWPSTSQSNTLRSDTADILHGLPMPQILRPISE